MDTKEKILEVALRQFNELGTDAVTVRSIAQEVGISHGNLCYHFSNTDAIILALYQKIVGEMNEQTEQALEPSSELELLLRIGERGFRILYRYKFLILDFVRISRRIPQIQAAYRELMKFREQQFLQLFQNMVAKKWFIPAPIPNYYENLAERMLVNADSWIPHAEIHFDGTPEEAIQHYYRIYISEFLPLLTKKSQSLYKELFPQFS